MLASPGALSPWPTTDRLMTLGLEEHRFFDDGIVDADRAG
jgi:hypothetical protein